MARTSPKSGQKRKGVDGKESEKPQPTPRGDGESVSGYFRAIFKKHPSLLKARSNEELLQRWLADHPDEKEVPGRVKNSLANLKSVLRKKLRKRTGRSKGPEEPISAMPTDEIATLPTTASPNLETLEEQIDDCLTWAKSLDREGLESVINLLRRARNEVVWKLGQ
jgi:hypothetical protein